MKRRDRILAAALLAALAILAALLFGPALASYVLEPTARGLWALLSVFVLSADQSMLWTFALLAAAVAAIGRAAISLWDASARQGAEAAEPDRNAALASVAYWRYLLASAPRGERERVPVRRELARLLLAAHSAKDRREGGFSLYRELESRGVDLPDGVHALLFAEEPRRRGAGARVRGWLRRASGREEADYRRALEGYVEYLKAYMEIEDER